jgi:transposase InsO family protein
VRLRIVREVLHGANQVDVALAFGLSTAAVQKYLTLYRHGGVDALRPALTGATARRKRSDSGQVRREAVVDVRKAHPEWGTRRIRDVLARFEGLGIPETVVRRILHEEGLIDERTPAPARSHPPRRFERAAPNQMWQSDIFTFLLRRHERLYVAAFLDDHSRYLVSYALAHHQKATLVLEALERGLASYGSPEEVLTDQGRQYTAWRGETTFEETLRQYGVRHVKSRPQHPETLGKIERFWKTLWDEVLSRTVFSDFADCDRRLGLYIQHYNFQRPHQALSGLVPADRFFRAAPHVRAAVEATVSANALRLARSQPPRKPFYLVGRLGDQDLSIAAQGGALTVKMGEAAQTIDLSQGDDDEPTTHDESERQAQAESAADTALADRASGSGSGRAEALPSDLERAVGGEAGDSGDRGDADLERLLLSARDQGAFGDAAGGSARLGQRDDAGRGERVGSRVGAGDQDRQARAGQAADRAAALPHAPDSAGGSGGDGTWAAQDDQEQAALDAQWLARFAELEAQIDDPTRDIEPIDFDPDAGWRGRAVSWERKLAGASAPHASLADQESKDGAQKTTERTTELPASTDGAATGSEPVYGADPGPGEPDDRERRSATAELGARELSDAGPPRQGGADRGLDAAAKWSVAPLVPRGEAFAGSRGAASRQGQAPGAARDDGSFARGGGRRDPRPAPPRTQTELDELVASLEALLDRGGRVGDGAESDPHDDPSDDDDA